VLALVLRWTMDARRDTATEGELVLRCAEPTLDTTHLQRLLAERLAQSPVAGTGALPATAYAGDRAAHRARRQFVGRVRWRRGTASPSCWSGWVRASGRRSSGGGSHRPTTGPNACSAGRPGQMLHN